MSWSERDSQRGGFGGHVTVVAIFGADQAVTVRPCENALSRLLRVSDQPIGAVGGAELQRPFAKINGSKIGSPNDAQVVLFAIKKRNDAQSVREVFEQRLRKHVHESIR